MNRTTNVDSDNGTSKSGPQGSGLTPSNKNRTTNESFKSALGTNKPTNDKRGPVSSQMTKSAASFGPVVKPIMAGTPLKSTVTSGPVHKPTSVIFLTNTNQNTTGYDYNSPNSQANKKNPTTVTDYNR